METLMVIILLTFVPVKDTDNVEIRYESKFEVTTMEYCKKVEAAFAEPVKGKSAIVLCKQSVTKPNHYKNA